MKRRAQVFAVLIGGICVVAFLIFRRPVPTVDGKSLNQWARELSPEVHHSLVHPTRIPPDAKKHIDAEAAIKKPGTNSLTYLLEILERDETDPVARAENYALNRPILSQLVESNPTKAQAAVGLGAMGTAAQPAIPALISALTNSQPEVRRAAAEALGRIREEPAKVIPALVKVLESNDIHPIVPASARWALGQFGEPGFAAIRASQLPNPSASSSNVLTIAENPLVSPRDTLRLAIDTDGGSFDGHYTVRQGGYILLPRVGRVNLAGVSLIGVERRLREQLTKTGYTTGKIKVELIKASATGFILPDKPINP